MKVSLFVTCVVDQLFPRVGLATVKLLRGLGVEVTFNPEQTCCGQPAFNSGYRAQAREVASHFVGVFERELASADYVVAPSGSCVTMVRKFYHELFAGDDAMLERAARVGRSTYELSEFLVRVMGVEATGARWTGRVTYHDSCHLLRELNVSGEPRALLRNVEGIDLVDMDRPDACCGFGGAFSVKYPEISAAIAEEKAASICRSGADTVVACDASCLMQIEELLARKGSPARCLHIAELLAASDE